MDNVFGVDAPAETFAPEGEEELFPEANELTPPLEPPAEEPDPGQPEGAPPQEIERESTEAPQPEAEQPTKYLGKFDSIEAWEAAHRNLESHSTRVSQENARLRETIAEREQMLAQAAQVLQARQGPEDPENPEASVQALINKAVAERLAPVQQQQAERVEQERLAQIQAFKSEHPDLPAYQSDVYQIVQENRFDPETREEVFPPTKANLELALQLAKNPQARGLLQALDLHPDPEYVASALEVAQDPNLTKVVMAHPHVMDSEAGMAWAREQAGLPQVVTQAKGAASQAQAQAAEAQRKAAYVEKGEAGAPLDAAPKQAQDPLEEALFDQINKGSKSVFGV